MSAIHPLPSPEPAPQADADERARRRRLLSRTGVIAVMVLSVLLVIAAASVSLGLPLGKSLEPMASPTLVLTSSDGQAFARRGAYKEAPVDAAKLPDHVKLAFVAIEDRRFYRHGGVDPRGIMRAFARDLKTGSFAQGGSTITQQLAKNAFTSGKRTLRRKAREAMIALYLESRLSKDEILSRYLSSVYFGDGVFGLRGAARHYFDKTPDQLSPAEAAMLAGVVKAPTKLAPTENLEAARKRARVVLAAMADMGVITRAQAIEQGRDIRLREGRPELPIGSYFADWVSPQAKLAFDRAYGEIKVQTTLDSRLQAAAEKALDQVLSSQGATLHATQGAVIAMRTDGQVLALVGGRNYGQSQYNRAVQAQRQPGSSFKPFVYLAALRRGATPDTLVSDAPLKIGGWSPENHESHYSDGPITLRQAFAKSSNVAAVRLAQQTGIAPIQQAARDLGITTPLPNDLTLALGSANVTLMQMTSAYAGIAAGTAPVTAYGLISQPTPRPNRPLGAAERQGLLQLMRAVVTSGTGTAANVGAPAFGKTGTSQDYRDAYFIGFVGDTVIGVWVGNDDNTPMKRVVGGMLPAQIWRQVMSAALASGKVHGAALLDAVAPAQPIDPAAPPAEAGASEDEAAPDVNVDNVPRLSLPFLRPQPQAATPAEPPRRAFVPPPVTIEPRRRGEAPPPVDEDDKPPRGGSDPGDAAG